MAALGAALLAVGPGEALASGSTVAVEQGPMVGLVLRWLQGQSPAGDYSLGGAQVHLRGGTGSAGDYLGTVVGVEYGLWLAYAGREAESVRRGAPLTAGGALGLSLRAHTFDLPCDGMMVVHLGIETEAGGAQWWSDSPRFAFTAGARLALRPSASLRLELDYSVLPHVFTSAPNDWSLRRTEHRAALHLGIGAAGLLLWSRYTQTRWESPEQHPRQDGLELGAGMEWRSE